MSGASWLLARHGPHDGPGEQNHRFALRHADRAYLIEKGAIQHEAAAAELDGNDDLQRYLGV